MGRSGIAESPIVTLKALALTAVLAFAAAGAAPASSQAQSLVIKGPDGQSKTIGAAELKAMRRTTVKAGFGDRKTYEGVSLTDLLAEVGAPSEVRLHGPALRQVVTVKGTDGFWIPLSIAETSAGFRGTPTILADTVDGAPLAKEEAPFRLIVGGDLKAARSVRMVAEIAVRKLD